MKIYFTASSIYKSKNKYICEKIINFLENKGHEVFGNTLSEEMPIHKETTVHRIKEWYKEWSSYIQNCDFVIVEASYPSSVHIGFEIGNILSKGKPLILLFKESQDPIYINNLHSSKLVKSEYTSENIIDILTWCLKEIEQVFNRRFTFFISPEIEKFLDEMSKKEKISRSEYIRRLIENRINGDHS